jgi:hypothetical protein
MQQVIIGATFVLGVALVLMGVVAFFKKLRGGGQGSLKVLGIELSGAGPVVILLAGSAMTLSGFGWAASQKDASEARRVATTSDTQRVACAVEKQEIVADAVEVIAHAQTLEEQNRRLIDAVQVAATTRRLPDAAVLSVKPMALPPNLKRAIEIRTP